MRDLFILPVLILLILGNSTACSGPETRDGGDNEGASGERGASDTGCIVGDCADGQGTYVWPGGSIYVGQFKSGMRNGTGTYSWPSGSQYVGEYLDGLRHGKGAYTWSDGHNYVGEFQSDTRHGPGVYAWPDGTVFEGVWENDQRGEGQFSRLSDG